MFAIGHFIYLKLQPYRHISLKSHGIHTLHPKFYCPFMIEDCVGVAACKFQLPASGAMHNVFHVSHLKLCPNPHGQQIQHLPALVAHQDNTPLAILDKKMVKRGQHNSH